MGAPSTTLCEPWVDADDVTACVPCAALADSTNVDVFSFVASEVLFFLTALRFPGECTITVRPTGCGGGCGCWRGDAVCGCCGPSEVRLDYYPIVAVDEIVLDGIVLPATDYRIDDYRTIVRLPAIGSRSGRSWPCCQRLDLPTSERDTWQITFKYGVGPPEYLRQAAAAYACQLALACEGSDDCQLDDRVQSVVRENVTLTFTDVLNALQFSKTGIATVDRAIRAANPYGLDRPPSIVNPDRMSATRRVGT